MAARRHERRLAERGSGGQRSTTPRSSSRRRRGSSRRVALGRRGPPRLGGRRLPPELVDGAVERLTELGMLDDEAFARAWVESRDRAHPGVSALSARSSAARASPAPTIDVILAERRGADGAEPDRDAAERLLERNRRSLARVADPRQRRARAYALLARNGFDPDVCRGGRSAVRGARRPGGCARKPLMPGTARDRRAHLRIAPGRPRWQPRPIDDRDHGHVQRFGPPSRYSPRDSSRPGTCPDISALPGAGEADRW